MDLQIRPGTAADLDALARLYDAMNDHLARTVNYPGWTKGIYPVRQDAEDGLRDGSLFVAVDGAELLGSFLLRQTSEPAYAVAPWQAELADGEVLVLHTFVVSPHVLGQGLGRRMLAFAEQYARARNVKALRLDVYEANRPAMRLYETCGFHYVATVSLGLEDCGLDWFRLYEKLL